MNITSCDNCGVVLDKDKLDFPSDIYSKETGDLIEGVAEWDGENYVPIAKCPVCQSNIRGEE